MASIVNLSSTQLISFHRSPSFHPRNTPTLSFNLHPNPSSNLRPISLKPYHNSRKPQSWMVATAVKKLGETELVTVSDDGSLDELPKKGGVYAVYDKDGELQFIGVTPNIAGTVSARRKSLSELCDSVKVGVVDEPDREAVIQAGMSWLKEHVKIKGKVPPGNESGNNTWARQPLKKKPGLSNEKSRN